MSIAALFRVVVAGALLVSPLCAHSTIIDYDFTTGGPHAPNPTFGNDSSLAFQDLALNGLQLTVTGGRNNGTAADLVTWNANGLGVRINDNDDRNALDSSGPNERLIFAIDDLLGLGRGLELNSIDFRSLNQGSGENFTLFVDGDRIVRNFTPGTDNWMLADDLPSIVAFDEFFISVNDRPVGTETAIRVAGIGGTIVTVPEPGSLALFFLGLVALLGLRRQPSVHRHGGTMVV